MLLIVLTLCPLGNFIILFCRLLIFQNQIFEKNILGILSECQTVWIHFVGPDLGPICLQRLSADDTEKAMY